MTASVPKIYTDFASTPRMQLMQPDQFGKFPKFFSSISAASLEKIRQKFFDSGRYACPLVGTILLLCDSMYIPLLVQT